MIRMCFVFVLWILYMPVQAAVPSSALFRQYLSLSNDKALANASWAILVHDASADQLLLSHQAHLPVSPASTQKLITTATALLVLGNNYQYQTKLQYDGHITDGVLYGHLYIKGSGDPSLGAAQMDDSLSLQHLFSEFTRAVKHAGIKEITGNIYADASCFEEELVSPKWLWEDIGNYYGAGSCGLNVNENEYTVYFQAGSSIGAPAQVLAVSPEVCDMTFDNRVKTGSRTSGDQVYIYGAPYNNRRLLSGTVPLGANRFPVRGSLPDPPAYVAKAFKTHLSEANILLQGQGMRMQHKHPGHESPTRHTLFTWHSPDLFELVYRTNHESINSYAEALLKTIGAEVQQQGSSKAGLQSIKEFWTAKGVEFAEARLLDGSGLSPLNRITAAQLLEVLIIMTRETPFPVFLQSLPLAGHSGTLKRHFHGSFAEGVLRAKSGFLSNTIAYAGYTPMENGHLAAFVIIVNDYHGPSANMRQKILDMMSAIRSHQ